MPLFKARSGDLARMAAYERSRMCSAKSMWIFLAMALLSTMAAGGTLALGENQDVANDGTARILWIDVLVSPVSVTAIIAGVAGAAIAGQELRWGGLADVFVRLGRRRTFVFVKGASAALFGGFVCFVAVVGGWLVARSSGGGYGARLSEAAGLTSGDLMSLFGRVFVVGIFCALISLSMTFITRSLAAGIAIPIVWANVLEPLLAVFSGKGSILVRCLPYQNMRSFMSVSDSRFNGITVGSAGAVMLVSIVVLGISGVWRLVRYEH